MEYTKCPNCGKSLKGFLSADLLLQPKIDFINKQTGMANSAYCTSCSEPILQGIGQKLKQQKADLESRLREIIHNIPLMTSPAPIKWDYEVLGMATAQTTSGTGFATELSRSFNDFFGSTSNATNQKILAATNFCKTDLRVQCVRSGGNAIISTDIDFNEIGAGSTNMLMVCMAGTVIKVNDTSSLNEKDRDGILEVIEITQKLESISQL